jgi:hypothetical protein
MSTRKTGGLFLTYTIRNTSDADIYGRHGVL